MATDKLVDFDHVTDYISRDAALSCFHDWIDRYGHEHSADEMTEYQRIEELPAADVRPVVLCRDCVYYNTTGCADGFGWCEGVMVSKGTSDDFFCAEGKQNPYECGAEMERNLDTTKGDNHD